MSVNLKRSNLYNFITVMYTKKALIFLLLIFFSSISCSKDVDDAPVSVNEISDFVWKGMNIFYLYKSEIPNLADDRFTSNNDYNTFLNSFSNPEDLFESLIYQPEVVDRFSWIVDDYIALEEYFQGTSAINGMEYTLFLAPNSNNNVIGFVKLVLPNTSAALNGVERGDLFYGIDGVILNRNNLNQLLSQDSYTINLGVYNDNNTVDTTDDFIEPTQENITLTKDIYTENPIYKTETFNVAGERVGYLMYNSFTSGSENELNTVFGDFKSNNIQHLVLDLRYNPGGSVTTTTFLASMITGQFTGQVFEKLVFNENFQSENTSYVFKNKLQDGTPLNSLNLNKLYVLTSNGSASASEGLINGLSAYIDVIQIGTNTTGKTQASITIYDSPNFDKQNINPNHTYAMQPLVANGLNKNDVSVPGLGLVPTIGFEYEERPLNYGILGDENEPMLALALSDIENSLGRFTNIKTKPQIPLKIIANSSDFVPHEGGMIID